MNAENQLNPEICWSRALEVIKGQMSEVSFKTWFAETTAFYEDGMFVITCPNAFASEWLRARYGRQTLKAVEEATGDMNVIIAFRALAKEESQDRALNDRIIGI